MLFARIGWYIHKVDTVGGVADKACFLHHV